LSLLLQRPNALVLLTGGEGVVVGGHLLEAVMQFQQLRRQYRCMSSARTY
jgi:hypothetical protein